MSISCFPHTRGYKAGIVEFEQVIDVAVLHVYNLEDELIPIPLGVSEGLKAGQKVRTIGHPLGYINSFIAAHISYPCRSIRSTVLSQHFMNVIQLDRHISSGNSGGPLLDHLGRLIRIVVASAPNFGFSIPIDSVMSCAGMLLKLEKAMGSTDEAMEGSTDMEIDVSERRLSNTVSYDDGEGEDETIVYDASFQEMEDNYVKYQTAQWVLYSLLLIPAWGIGFFMLLYRPVRRYISRKEFQSRKLYVTHNSIVYKDIFSPFSASIMSESRM